MWAEIARRRQVADLLRTQAQAARPPVGSAAGLTSAELLTRSQERLGAAHAAVWRARATLASASEAVRASRVLLA